MKQATRTDYQHSMEQRLAETGAALDRIGATAKDLGGAVRDEVQELVEQLRTERETLGRMLQQLRSTDTAAWNDYRETVHQAHRHLDTELRIAEAELEGRLAASREEFTDTVAAELEAWRTRIDDLRLQAQLARMDTQDELEPVVKAMLRRRSELEHRLGDLREATDDTWQSIRGDLTDGLAQLRRSLHAANERLSR